MFSASFAVLREHLSSIVVYQTVRPGDYDMTTSNDQPHMTRVPASFLPPIVLDRTMVHGGIDDSPLSVRLMR